TSPDAARTDPRRTIRSSSADCRWAEVSLQGRCYTGECQQVPIYSRARGVADSRVAVVFRHSFWSVAPGHRPQRRAALHFRDYIAWRVRRCAGGMGIEFEVSLDGRHALVSANDQL